MASHYDYEGWPDMQDEDLCENLPEEDRYEKEYDHE